MHGALPLLSLISRCMISFGKSLTRLDSGSVFVPDPDEVVAVMIITRALFAYSHIAWSNCRFTYESRLVSRVFKDNVGWIECAGQIIESQGFKNSASSSRARVSSYDGGERGWKRGRDHFDFWYDEDNITLR